MGIINKLFYPWEMKESKEIKDKNDNLNKAFEEVCNVKKEEEKEEEKKKLERIKNLPKYKKIIGYKAFKFDLSSFFGEMSYEVDREYSIEEPLIPCKQGYHFCLTLKDVMKLFPPIFGIRYFKVEVEVPGSWYIDLNDKERFVPRSCANFQYSHDLQEWRKKEAFHQDQYSVFNLENRPDFNSSKYTSLKTKYIGRTIKLLEEVPFQEYQEKATNFVIKTEEDYRSVLNFDDLSKKILRDWINRTTSTFSAAFADFVGNASINRGVITVNRDSNQIYQTILNNYENLVNAFNSIKDENVSQDVKVLFMMKVLKL